MFILGIDPGTARLGYGVIETKNGHKRGPVYVDAGCIITQMETPMGERLLYLQQEIGKVLEKHKPDILAIEQLFFGANSKTAMAVGQARGVVMAEAARYKVPIAEYQGLTVKVAVTGYGRSDKKEVLKGVHRLLGMRRELKPDDVADGLAIALCHFLKSQKN